MRGWAQQRGTARALAMGVVLCLGTVVARGSMAAQGTGTVVPGFGVRYVTPAGWTLSGKEGRIQAWSNAAQTEALVLYAGHFGPLSLALGDAQRILGVPADEDTKVITPLAPTTFGAHQGMAGSVRITGARSVVAHVAVVQLNDSTVLGAVAVLEGTAPESALQAAVQTVSTVLTGATLEAPSADDALRTQITGAWDVQKVYTSSANGGGYSNEESWTFNADGTFAYRKRFSVSLPGAAVTPEERDDKGRWYAVGGAVVLVSDEGRLTVDVQFADGKLVLDGTTFSRR